MIIPRPVTAALRGPCEPQELNEQGKEKVDEEGEGPSCLALGCHHRSPLGTLQRTGKRLASTLYSLVSLKHTCPIPPTIKEMLILERPI